ncbi:MAG TPA: hypothetical protein VID30_10050 [Bradyrhizobium sp.]|jgi:hypothetical protein
MAASDKLVDLLRSNLDKVAKPSSYDDLRRKLSSIKSGRAAPAIKESPENIRPITSFENDG